MSNLQTFVQWAGNDIEKWKRIIGASLVSICPERGTGVVTRIFKNKQGLLCLTVRYADGVRNVYGPHIHKTHKDLPIVISTLGAPSSDTESGKDPSLSPKGRTNTNRSDKGVAPKLHNAKPFFAFAGLELARWKMLVGQRALVTNKPKPLVGLIESVSEHLGSVRLMIQFDTVPAGFADPREILKISVSDAMRNWIVPFSHGWTREDRLDRKYDQTVEGRPQPSQADLFSFFAKDDYKTWGCLEGHKTEHHCAPLGEAKILKVDKDSLGIVLILRYSNGEIGKLYSSDVHRVHDTVTIPRGLTKQYWNFCSKLELLRKKHIQDQPKPAFMGKYGYSKLPPLMLTRRGSEFSSEWIFPVLR